MKSRWILATVVALVGLAAYVGNVLATPATTPPGFVGKTLAMATFGEIDSHDPVRADLAGDDQDEGAVRPLRPAEHMGSDPAPAARDGLGCTPSTGWHTHPGPSLVIVTQGTVTEYDGDDPNCGGRARSARRAAGRLLGQEGAALCVARGLRVRRAHARTSDAQARAAAARHLSLRGYAGAQCADHVGRSHHRGRGELPELDGRRSPARAGIPAAARRHRSEDGAAGRRSSPGTCRASRRSRRRHRGAARKPENRVHACRRSRSASGSPISIASTGRPTRRASCPRSPSATSSSTSPRSRRTCCRISPSAR